MFELLNVYNSEPLVIVVKHEDMRVEFDISTIINKRSKDELMPEKQFMLLNSYVNYKGEKFKKELMQKYIQAEDIIYEEANNPQLFPLPLNMVHDILDMFDLDDIYYFVKNVFQVKPPPQLSEKFDDNIVNTGKGTRVQTYIIKDYLELASLTIAVKSVLGPIGYFAYMKSDEINGIHKEYNLFNFISTHRIFKSNAMIKLFGSITVQVSIAMKDEETTAIRIIEKQISKEEFNIYMLSVVVLQKISIATIVDDSTDKNIIARVYHYVEGKLKVKGGVANSIRSKEVTGDVDGVEGDKESIVESYRIVSELSKGFEIELDVSASTVENIYKFLPIEVDTNIVNDALRFNRIFMEANITDEQERMLSFMFKTIIDPRGLEYMSIESIINLLSVGFAYLWALDMKHLAIILTSVTDTKNDTVKRISFTSNKNRITKELKDKLAYHFPYERMKNKDTSVNIVEETINSMANEMYDSRWKPNCHIKYIEEVGGQSIVKNLPSDLKLKLAEMIIKIEELRGE